MFLKLVVKKVCAKTEGQSPFGKIFTDQLLNLNQGSCCTHINGLSQVGGGGGGGGNHEGI